MQSYKKHYSTFVFFSYIFYTAHTKQLSAHTPIALYRHVRTWIVPWMCCLFLYWLNSLRQNGNEKPDEQAAVTASRAKHSVILPLLSLRLLSRASCAVIEMFERTRLFVPSKKISFLQRDVCSTLEKIEQWRAEGIWADRTAI